MPDLFSQVGSFLSGRIDHVPDADMISCIDTYQTLTGQSITVEQWRAFEQVQTLYLTHRLLKQVMPTNLPGVAGNIVGAGIGVVESGLQGGIVQEQTPSGE